VLSVNMIHSIAGMAKRKTDPNATKMPARPVQATPRLRKKSVTVALRQRERREDLLEAAHEIVLARGLEGLSTSSLASSLGVVPAALYRTVTSLDEIKAALVIRAVRGLEHDLTSALSCIPRDKKKKTALARIVVVARVLPELQVSEPARFRLIDQAIGSLEPLFDETLRAEVEVSTMRALAVVERVIIEAFEAGALAPAPATHEKGQSTPDVLTLALLALVHGATHLRKRDRFDSVSRSSRVVLDVAIRAFLIGCGANPTLVDDVLE
jgi:AcrR family transcriptional regulator